MLPLRLLPLAPQPLNQLFASSVWSLHSFILSCVISSRTFRFGRPACLLLRGVDGDGGQVSGIEARGQGPRQSSEDVLPLLVELSMHSLGLLQLRCTARHASLHANFEADIERQRQRVSPQAWPSIAAHPQGPLSQRCSHPRPLRLSCHMHFHQVSRSRQSGQQLCLPMYSFTRAEPRGPEPVSTPDTF